MQNPDPFEVHPVTTGQRNWRALIVSVIAHLLLIALILIKPLPAPEAGPVEKDENATPVTLAQRLPFQQPREQPRAQPQVPERPIPLGPNSKRPDEAPREASPQTPPIEEPDPTREPPPQVDPEPQPAPSESQPEPSQRILTPKDMIANGSVLGPPTSPFGRPTTERIGAPTGSASSGRSTAGAMGRTGFSQSDTRAWRESFPEAAGQCVEIPDLGRNPDGTPVLASVSGIVRDDRGRPLPGAHLQIVGQAFATFSDGQGAYRLEFDPSLLERCRVQIVRVSALGYRDADLHLAVGRNARSDDVLLRRR